MSVLSCVAAALNVWLFIAQTAMKLCLSSSSTLSAFLMSLSLNLSWTEDAVAYCLRLCVNVKSSLFTFCVMLTLFSYINDEIVKSVYIKLRFSAISNWRGRWVYISSALLCCLIQLEQLRIHAVWFLLQFIHLFFALEIN